MSNLLKRYLIFAGSIDYPNGGWHDFLCDTDSLEKALEIIKVNAIDHSWANALDTHTLEIVEPPQEEEE